MQEVTKEKDFWGQDVIYVSKCKNYQYEEQGKLT